MKTITIKEGCSTPVCLGEKGENGVGAVLFDYSEWLNDFGNVTHRITKVDGAIILVPVDGEV